MTEPTLHPMPLWRTVALDAYRIASQPWRQHLLARQAACHQAPVMMFFYHRVARMADTPWTISFATFRQQVDYLRKRYEMVSFEESIRRIRYGNDRPTAHITFDDGYAANCEEAIPYLIATGIPTTYFVTSQHVLSGQPFQHDVERGSPKAVNAPQQIVAMADVGIEIGAHTRHHADLGQITDRATLEDEIAGSKRDLENLTGRPCRYFAFPYGTASQLTAPALQVCREAGFDAICSAVGGYNFPGGDSFHLQRIHGDVEMARFYNWATLDPRKLHPQLELPQAEQAAGHPAKPAHHG